MARATVLREALSALDLKVNPADNLESLVANYDQVQELALLIDAAIHASVDQLEESIDRILERY